MEAIDNDRGDTLARWLMDLSIKLNLMTIPINKLGLSNGTYHALNKFGIFDLSDILNNYDIIIAAKINHIGIGRIQEIQEKLSAWLEKNASYYINTNTSQESDPKSREDSTDISAQSPERSFNPNVAQEIGRNIRLWFSLRSRLNPKLVSFLDIEAFKFEPSEQSNISLEEELTKINAAEVPLNEIPIHPPLSLEESINLFLLTLSPRQRKITEDLYGFCNGQSNTLQAVSNYHGITRERVRQINLKVMIICKKRMILHPLENSIKALIRSENGAISHQRLVSKMNAEFINSGFKAEGILKFYLALPKRKTPEVYYFPALDMWSSKDYSIKLIERLSESIVDILGPTGVALQWNDLYQQIIGRKGLYTLDESFTWAVVKCLRDTGKINQLSNGCWALPGTNLSRQSRIVIALRQIGHPAHFTEITKVYNQLFPEKLTTPRSINAGLQDLGVFVRVGRGLYGLPEWDLPDDGNLANAARRVMITADRPMNLDEITIEVLKTWQVSTNSILVAIQSDSRFDKSADGMYYLTQTGMTNKKTHKYSDSTSCDRVAETLRFIGRPEIIAKIAEKHNELYPDQRLTALKVSSLLTTHKELFSYLAYVTYGLVEWEINSQQYIADKIVTSLHESSQPIYLNEPEKGFRKRHGVSRAEFRDVVRRDPRLKIFQLFLGLSEWEESDFIETFTID